MSFRSDWRPAASSAEAEGAVFSMTYLWGKPWLLIKRIGRTAEGASFPRR
jgi:hypothetical protein